MFRYLRLRQDIQLLKEEIAEKDKKITDLKVKLASARIATEKVNGKLAAIHKITETGVAGTFTGSTHP